MRTIRPNRRRGYTLIEMLVVVAIIVVLISLTAAAVFKFRDAGPRSATQTNLSKIRASIGNQWKAVSDKAHTGAKEPAFLAQAKTGALASAADSDPRVKNEYVRLKLLQAFPTSFSDALAPASNPSLAWPAYTQYLNSFGVNTGNSASWPSAEIQASICVLMILEKGPSNTGLTKDDLGTGAWKPYTLSLTPAPPAGTPPPPGIADGWTRPIRFTWTFAIPDSTITLTSAGADGVFGNADDQTIVNP